ncbi:MAG: Wzz/FepE/Etk N-terminal domain-containing protein [Deltaproteobacteria bacterium]|nr:Wzz/FepE/Etk N-terminal domain-containing protein [Deltaproteobacteria bacterium]
MAEPDREQQRYDEEDEINLLDYWRVIRKRQKIIIRVIIATVLATVVISLFMTNIYQAKAVITPVMPKEGARGGSLSALAQQFGGIGGLAGIALPGGTTASEIVALLESNILREKVIERYNLMPVLFYEDWDAEKKDWKRGGIKLNPLYYMKKLTGMLLPEAKGVKKKDDDIPDIWDGIRMLDDDIVNVKNNIKDNTITITADFHDAETTAKIVEYFLVTLTDHMSSEAKRVATINKQYLEGELGKTADPLLRQKIYELIAQQLETSMTAEVKENFAFKVIDPPKAPDKKIKPKRALMVIVSFILSVFIGVFLAFFMEYLEKVKSQERECVNT